MHQREHYNVSTIREPNVASDLLTDRRSSENFITVIPDKVPNQADSGEIKKHSVILDGHRTSVSLEDAFWTDLKRFAANCGITINQLVTEIDRNRTGNLSSAIRIYVLQQYRELATIV